MSYFRSVTRSAAGCIALLLLAGCLAPPKRHAWQISGEEMSRIKGADTWQQLSTNDYARVPDSERSYAVALLKEQAFVQLDAAQLALLAPDFPARSDRAEKPYLVRGVLYSSPPLYTIVRFDPATARLLVQQFTYNGEMVMPFRWVAQPNALVVFLRRPPEHVYPDAVLGGDWIARGAQWNTLDNR